jgi:hypothetical protein
MMMESENTRTLIAPSAMQSGSPNGVPDGSSVTTPSQKPTTTGGGSAKTKKLTKFQLRLLERAKASPVMVAHHPEFQDKWTLQNGAPVNPNTAQKLIERGLLVPAPDGLFDGFSQSYRPE